MQCVQCEQPYCDNCHRVLHRAPSKRTHEAAPIGGETLVVELQLIRDNELNRKMRCK